MFMYYVVIRGLTVFRNPTVPTAENKEVAIVSEVLRCCWSLTSFWRPTVPVAKKQRGRYAVEVLLCV